MQHFQVIFECINQSRLSMTKEWTTLSLTEQPVWCVMAMIGRFLLYSH